MITLLSLIPMAFAQEVDGGEVLPVPEAEIEEPRRGPDRKSYEAIGVLQQLYQQEAEGRRASDAELERLREQLRRAAAEGPQPEVLQDDGGKAEGPLAVPEGVDEAPPEEASGVVATPRGETSGGADAVGRSSPADFLKGLKRPKVGDRVGGRAASPVPSGPSPLVFDVPGNAGRKVNVLPAGAYVKVRILTGVEADDRKLIPMMLQADYAAVGPNGTRIDLSGCMIVAQVKGQLATDRVVGKATKLSCVRDDGSVVDTKIEGYLAGEDSTLGVVGKLISRQGRVLAAATVANLAKGAGDAIATANTTTNLITTPIAGPTGEVAQNVTGNTTAFVAGSSMASAAEDVADWYLKYAEKLTPAIAVGSGRDIWVVLLETAEFPGLGVR